MEFKRLNCNMPILRHQVLKAVTSLEGVSIDQVINRKVLAYLGERKEMTQAVLESLGKRFDDL